SKCLSKNLRLPSPSLELPEPFGQEFLSVLSDRDFPYSSVKMLASKRSAGKRLAFDGREYTVEELTAESFDGVDKALFSAGGSISKEFGTYQAASGAGAAAMEELVSRLASDYVLEGKPPTCIIFGQQYAFNLFRIMLLFLTTETRKISNDTEVKVTATCIRVPVMRAHAESVNLQFENPLNLYFKFLKHRCSVFTNGYSTVCEFRLDIFICGDQIRKGAKN
ncbi:hypothetical protein ARALYDRAFT_472171, partial [Arabidopsis lyrata subsp. lyrata]